MQTLTIQIEDDSALKALESLEEKRLITIISDSSFDSPSVAGTPIGLDAFRNWIKESENGSRHSYEEVKDLWAKNRVIKL